MKKTTQLDENPPQTKIFMFLCGDLYKIMLNYYLYGSLHSDKWYANDDDNPNYFIKWYKW